MPLASPKLELPDVEETIAFRAIDRILRNDHILKRFVRHYNAWTGDAADIIPPATATCPSLQIAPRPSGSRWEAEGLHLMPMVIGITCAVNGSDVNQIMNFWGAVRRALFPLNQARLDEVKRAIAEAHIVKPTITLSGYGHTLSEKGARILVAQGTLELKLHIHTL